MSLSSEIAAIVTQLNAVKNVQHTPEIQAVVQQGCVLQAIAKDIELGNVPRNIDINGFIVAASEYCAAVSEFCQE